MRTTKSILGLIGALIPLLLIGGLLLHLNNVRNAFGGLLDGAIGPTMLGLGAIGLIFLGLFIWRIRRLAAPPAPPKSGGGTDDPPGGERSDFDPDAAIARYMARRAAGGPSAAPGDGGPVRPGSFGRKGA
jgi:hypothetical protein